MTKVAKLVLVSLMTRVVVDENATDEQILDAARPNFIEKVNTELGENLEEITNDTECPYGSLEKVEDNKKRHNITGGYICEPIGMETQLQDALEGPDKETQDSVRKKVEYTTTNVDKIHKINGSKVYNVTVDQGNLRYNLKNTGAYPQKYYYPIQYANIEFKE